MFRKKMEPTRFFAVPPGGKVADREWSRADEDTRPRTHHPYESWWHRMYDHRPKPSHPPTCLFCPGHCQSTFSPKSLPPKIQGTSPKTDLMGNRLPGPDPRSPHFLTCPLPLVTEPRTSLCAILPRMGPIPSSGQRRRGAWDPTCRTSNGSRFLVDR